MAITDTHVAALKAYLSADYHQYRELSSGFDEGLAGWRGYGLLTGAAFFEAVDQRFGSEYTLDDVIQFVAAVRAMYQQAGSDIDTRAAEQLILSCLGSHDDASDLDDETVVSTQTILLPALLSEGGESAHLDDLLKEARKLADSWIAEAMQLGDR